MGGGKAGSKNDFGVDLSDVSAATVLEHAFCSFYRVCVDLSQALEYTVCMIFHAPSANPYISVTHLVGCDVEGVHIISTSAK